MRSSKGNKAKLLKKNKRKLDNEWKVNVRKNWNNKCAVCGKDNCKLDCHHIVSRSITSLRNDEMNGILLCSGCHLFNRKLSAHKGSLLFIKWLMETWPAIYNYLVYKLTDDINKEIV